MIDWQYTLSQLNLSIHWLAIAFLLVAIITPMIGKLANRIGAIDLPRNERGRNDNSLNQRLHVKATPRLGGLGMALVFTLLMYFAIGINVFTVGLGIALFILVLSGAWDDIKNLPGFVQIIFQILAVICVILAGVRVESIQIMGIFVDFAQWTYDFSVWGQEFKLVLPADFLTMFWLLVIINAMNWVSGIDALEETMSWIAGITLMLLAIKFGNNEMLILTTIFTGVVLGFAMFNFPPAHIFSGTIGNTVLGLLLGVLSIQISGKFGISLILLAVPLVDFIWVLAGRLYRFRVFNPIKLMSISGKHHLHHRLMELGLNTKQVLYFETGIVVLFAAAAYFLAGFDWSSQVVLVLIAVIMLGFGFLKIKRNQYRIIRQKAEAAEQEKPKDPKKTPDKEYAY